MGASRDWRTHFFDPSCRPASRLITGSPLSMMSGAQGPQVVELIAAVAQWALAVDVIHLRRSVEAAAFPFTAGTGEQVLGTEGSPLGAVASLRCAGAMPMGWASPLVAEGSADGAGTLDRRHLRHLAHIALGRVSEILRGRCRRRTWRPTNARSRPLTARISKRCWRSSTPRSSGIRRWSGWAARCTEGRKASVSCLETWARRSRMRSSRSLKSATWATAFFPLAASAPTAWEAALQRKSRSPSWSIHGDPGHDLRTFLDPQEALEAAGPRE